MSLEELVTSLLGVGGRRHPTFGLGLGDKNAYNGLARFENLIFYRVQRSRRFKIFRVSVSGRLRMIGSPRISSKRRAFLTTLSDGVTFERDLESRTKFEPGRIRARLDSPVST